MAERLIAPCCGQPLGKYRLSCSAFRTGSHLAIPHRLPPHDVKTISSFTHGPHARTDQTEVRLCTGVLRGP